MRQFIFFLEVKLGLLLPITLLGLRFDGNTVCTVIIFFVNQSTPTLSLQSKEN